MISVYSYNSLFVLQIIDPEGVSINIEGTVVSEHSGLSTMLLPLPLFPVFSSVLFVQRTCHLTSPCPAPVPWAPKAWA